jgi:hypothetical protein
LKIHFRSQCSDHYFRCVDFRQSSAKILGVVCVTSHQFVLNFFAKHFKKIIASVPEAALDGGLVEEDGDGAHLALLVDPVEVVDVEVLAEPLELGQVGTELKLL